MNLCRTCGEDFASLGAFDRHRTCSFSPNDTRRCLDEDEMHEAGLELDLREPR